MDQHSFFKKTETSLQECIARLNDEYRSMQVGRANPSVLNKVVVDYYGTPTPVSQIAAVSVQEARILVVSPWDVSMLSAIEKAIQKANIGINPTNDGKVVRMVFPQLTGERRREIVKEIGAIQENFKIKIRNIRKKALDDIKEQLKQGEISEDEERQQKEKIQSIIDEYIKKVNEVSKVKEDEVLAI